MKKRIGILEGKPIITGDKNLKTSNEIHISDLKGVGSGSGSGSGESGNAYPTKYYKVLDSSVINEDLMLWLSGGIVDLLGPKPAGFFMQDESYNQYITKISFNPVTDFNGILCHTIEELTNNDENILSKLESITEEEYYSE